MTIYPYAYKFKGNDGEKDITITSYAKNPQEAAVFATKHLDHKRRRKGGPPVANWNLQLIEIRVNKPKASKVNKE